MSPFGAHRGEIKDLASSRLHGCGRTRSGRGPPMAGSKTHRRAAASGSGATGCVGGGRYSLRLQRESRGREPKTAFTGRATTRLNPSRRHADSVAMSDPRWITEARLALIAPEPGLCANRGAGCVARGEGSSFARSVAAPATRRNGCGRGRSDARARVGWAPATANRSERPGKTRSAVGVTFPKEPHHATRRRRWLLNNRPRHCTDVDARRSMPVSRW